MSVICPHCKVPLNMVQRRLIAIKPVIRCFFCNKLVRVNERSRYINCGLLGVLAYFSIGWFPHVDAKTHFIVSIALITFLQGVLDIFYPLESAERVFFEHSSHDKENDSK
jgi:phage FluMu protein Com